MKKNFLFSMLAVLLAGFWFGGASLAAAVVSNCEGVDTSDQGIISVSTAEDLGKGLQCSEVREIKLNADIEIKNNIISTNNENLKLNLGTYKVTADDLNYIIELYGKYEIIGEEGSDFIVRYIDVYGCGDVAGELTITSGTFHTNMYPNDDTTIKIDGGNIYGRLMSYGSDSKIIINDGAIRNDKGDGIDMTNGGYLEVNGGTIESTYDNPNEKESDGDAILLSYRATYGAPECVINGGIVRGLFNGITIYGNGSVDSAKLTVNGGLIEGQNAGVSGNGSDTDTPSETTKYGGTKIVINDGKIVGNTAIYHPQYGVLTVEGGEIEGVEEAIEMRAGELNISGGKFTATTDVCPANVTPNGNGSTTEGAAIAIAQHSTKKAITVNISGGEFNACAAVNQAFPQAHDAADEAKVSTTITDGTFNGVVARSGDNSVFSIQGGIFSAEPDESYIAAGKKALPYGESQYKVATAWTVTFNPDNESGTTGVDVEDNTTVDQPADPTNTGYIFQGWFNGEDLFEFATPITADTTLTAQWEAMTSSGGAKIDDETDEGTGMVVEADVPATETDASAVQSSNSTATVQGEVELNVYNDADLDGNKDGDPILTRVNFTSPVLVRIPVNSGSSAKVKVKHNGDSTFGTEGLTTSSTTCNNGVSNVPYNGADIAVTSGYVEIYTCSASTFVAYTEVTNPTSSSSTSGGGGGGGSSSYSCKSLPANAVANNTSKPKKNTNYSYSTDTGAVCTFQCKSGYTWNEKDEKCEKSEETVADTNENTDNADTSDSTTTEDLKKVLDDGYTVEFHNAYDFAFKNGITTMSSIDEAHMNSPLTRIAMAKMLSQYAINVLGKKPANVVVPNFPDVSPELDAEYNNGVTLAYQLGIMGINIENFRPDDLVTRAEFATALSRLLYNTPDGEGAYYETHLKKLMEEKVITVADPDMHELRGYVMIMLMRSAKNN